MPIHPFPESDLRTERLVLSRANRSDAAELLAYYGDNRAHLGPWEPLRPDDFYTAAALEARLDEMGKQMRDGKAIHFLMRRAESGALVGECNFTNIVRGPFQACHMGFSLSAAAQGHGLMHEALSAAIRFVFDEYGLHRVMANYRPENQRSAHVLRRLGFEIEGSARAYLKINGEWADHVLTSKINDAVSHDRVVNMSAEVPL
ncbi:MULTISPECIES: GNAT family N-acetyltransferase [unclassified Caballeronia]|uniref:GNAT family N-acetyltransferase n=1 Tax=unclassified Caballeronia TaxID=2646786 RepID=UPI0028571267|nr:MULTISPECIES: GNAT family N-acetyltransferase [unclassified Caballeronia]MDR5822798.1 GNAT family N-acetyltransferase [Caballeronia sp. LZ043]MDR5880852.1 GNAT family N-acetyltransferase [Caballeronia sp. LZ032]